MCLMCEMEALYFAQLAEQQRLAGENAAQPPAPAPAPAPDKRDAFTCDEPKKAE
jgi:hypothetical protein